MKNKNKSNSSFKEFDDRKTVKSVDSTGKTVYKSKADINMDNQVVVSTKYIKNTLKRGKKYKAWIVGLATVGALGLAGSIAGPIIALNKNAGGGSSITTYNVTFKDGDTTFLTQKVVENEKAVKPQDPTKTDYEFDGWYKEKELKNKFDFSQNVNSNLTLYAKWNAEQVFAPTVAECPTATTIRAVEDSNVYFYNTGVTTKIKYSTTGKGDWTEVNANQIIKLSKGSNLYLIGDNENGLSSEEDCYWNICISGKCNVGGSVMGLLYNGAEPTVEQPQTTIPCNYCFYYLFSGSSGINKINENYLPATTLKSYCYYCMFNNCGNLLNTPKLPAIDLTDANGCYYLMFSRCGSLTSSAEMSAEILSDTACCSMYSECYSLVSASDLKVKTLTSACYQAMFEGCTNLVTTPKIYAETLTSFCCNGMFSGCTSLKTISQLDIKTVGYGCCQNMFKNCTSLTNLPTFSATNLAGDACFAGMFENCTSLTVAPSLPATAISASCYRNMFKGCISLTTAPTELPATKYYDPKQGTETDGLAQYCYQSMFQGCTALTNAPSLPATTLANYCYQTMFSGCTSLHITETTGKTKSGTIFTCPAITGLTKPVTQMFLNTAGDFYTTANQGTPTASTTLYWYVD